MKYVGALNKWMAQVTLISSLLEAKQSGPWLGICRETTKEVQGWY